MKAILTALAIIIVAASVSFAATPNPGPLTIEFGCQCVKLHWGAADSAEFHPDGYIIYRAAETRYDWTQITPHLITDTSYIDYDLVIGDQFNYAVVAHYADGNSSMSVGEPQSIYDATQHDYFIVGNEASGDLNWWYKFKLDSLGLNGVVINDLLPYCGDMLDNLKLLVIVRIGDGWGPINGDTERENVIADYLDRDGRLYVHDGSQTWSMRLTEDYLGYGYTLCTPYPFTSMHGLPGTFADRLRFSFTETLYSSNLAITGGDPNEYYDVIEDDVECGCVDMAVNRAGYKAVINSQPLELVTGNDTSGTVLTYFERMMEFFDILSSVNDDTPGQLPGQISLFAYPNPFNSSVKIRLVNSNLAADQTVSVFDIAGRQVRTITMPRRDGEVVWDGRDDSGQSVTSGIYFAKIVEHDNMLAIKLTLMK